MVSRWGVALFSAPPPVPFFPEVHEELTRSWKAPFTARNKSCSSSALTTLDGGAALGYVGIPSVEQSAAMQLCPTAAITLRDYPCLPSRACKYLSGLTGSAYRACGEATSALHAVALLQVHQAKALKDLHEGGHDLVVLHELRAATDLALRPTKVTAQSLGKSTLVVQECHLWLCLADMKEHEKVQYMLPCRRPASLAMLSKALPSTSRQHRSRLRQSCAGGNLLLPIRLHPLSLLVAMGAPLWPPPLSRSRSSLPPGSIMEPVSGRIPSPSRLPPTRWNQVSVTFYNQTRPCHHRPGRHRPPAGSLCSTTLPYCRYVGGLVGSAGTVSRSLASAPQSVPVAPVDHQTRLCDSVRPASPQVHFSQGRRCPFLVCGNRIPAGEGCDKAGPSSWYEVRVLQPLLHFAQEKRWVTTDLGSASFEPCASQAVVATLRPRPGYVPKVPTTPPQPVGFSGQLGKEQTLPDAEDLFSRYGVGFGRTDSTPHRGTCVVGVELLEFIQGQDSGPTE